MYQNSKIQLNVAVGYNGLFRDIIACHHISLNKAKPFTEILISEVPSLFLIISKVAICMDISHMHRLLKECA